MPAELKGNNLDSFNFGLSYGYYDTVVSGSAATTLTTGDFTYLHQSSSTVDRGAQITITPTGILDTSIGPIYTNLTPTIASLSNGNISRLSDGTSSILCTVNKLTKRIDVSVARVTSQPADTFASYQNNSAALHSINNVDGRAANKIYGIAVPVFSTQDHISPLYIRNTNNWLYDIDLTCMSPWNSDGGITKAGTLISPRHLIYANHYPINHGSIIRFITRNNEVVERTLSDSTQIADTDIRLGVLDSDVPSSIGFARTLPPNWASYFPSLYAPPNFTIGRIGVVATDYEEKIFIKEIYGFTNSYYISLQSSTNPPRSVLSEAIIGGDSGNPAFLIINNTLVLLGCWWTSVSTSNITYWISQINSAMTSLGGGYQLTPIGLGGFDSY